MPNELKPCPFCGGNAHQEIFDDGFFVFIHIECVSCGAKIVRHYETGSEGATAWNRRANDEQR